MRTIAFSVLILAAGIGSAVAQTSAAAQRPGAATPGAGATPQRRLSEGQSWVVQQESMALASPYRLSVIASQVAQERQNRSIRQLPVGRPQRELR